MGRRSGFKKRYKDGAAGLAGGANNASRAYSPGEIYEGGGGGSYFADSVPVGYWTMEDGSGSTVSDVSSAGNNLDATTFSTFDLDEQATELWDSTTQARGTYSLAHNKNYSEAALVDDNDLLDFNSDDSFSISCWVKRSGNSNGETGGGLVTKMAASSPSDAAYEGYAFYLTDGSMKQPRFLLYKNNTEQLRIAGGGLTEINDTDWHHLVLTYSGTAAVSGVKIYLDNSSLSLSVVNRFRYR